MIAASDPPKTIRKEVIERMKNIGIDIGKGKCIVCVMDGKGSVLERTSYVNTLASAKEFARRMKKEYGGKGRCRAACESTGNMWLKTFEAFEECGVPVKLANTYKMKIISDTDVKTDPIDAQKIANALRAGIIPECYVAPPDLRDVRELLRYRISMVQARTALINYTHGLLDKYDVMPDVSKMYTKKAVGLLSQIRLGKPNDSMILQKLRQKNCTCHGGDIIHRGRDRQAGRSQRGRETADEHDRHRGVCRNAAGLGDRRHFQVQDCRPAGLMDGNVSASLPVRQRDAPRPHEKGVQPEGKLDNDPGRQRGGAP